jgi:hypothetical protein
MLIATLYGLYSSKVSRVSDWHMATGHHSSYAATTRLPHPEDHMNDVWYLSYRLRVR